MTELSAELRAASISFRQLRLFDSVARLQSFRRASEECNLSQPAVTQALAKLEQQVGVELLERRANGSYLNELGRIMHRRVSRFVEQIEHALVELGTPGGQAAVFARRLSRSKVRSLIALIESKCLRAAAESLGLSPAALQRVAHDLERCLQKQLYHHDSGGMIVTQAAREFGRKIKLATQEVEWGIAEIDAVRGSSSSKIVVGAMLGGGSVLLASVLNEFVTAHPHAELQVVNEGAPAMMWSLRTGVVDFVIGLGQENLRDDLVSETLAHTPYHIACRRGHRLLQKGKVTREDLLGCEWIAATPNSSRGACFKALFGNARPPRATIVTSSLQIIRHVLAHSDRLTILTSYELAHEADVLVPIPFPPIEPVPAIGITSRANWCPTQLHTDFIAFIRRRMKQFSQFHDELKLAS
jgi:DNA-binding transcriptional LysR family regulator